MTAKTPGKIFSKESIKYLVILIVLTWLALRGAFWLGAATQVLTGVGAATIWGDIYGIITSSVAFFIFVRYMRVRKTVEFVRKFVLLYLIVYFVSVIVFLIPLLNYPYFFFSTLGNALILYSIFLLLSFLLSPEILGISENVRTIFLRGKHMRVVVVYLGIMLLQVFGYSLLNWAIQIQSGGLAFELPGGGVGSWFDFLYYSIITFTTIGFGDIHPMIGIAKFSTVTQAVVSQILTVLFLAILIVYMSSTIGGNVSEHENDAEEVDE